MSKKVMKGLIGKSGIYAIKIAGKRVYIGSGSDLESRYSNHKSLLRNNKHHNKQLQQLFNELGGLDNFDFEVLEYCNKRDLYIKEKYYLEMFKDIAVNIDRIIKLEKKIRRGIGSVQHRKRWSNMMSGSNNPNNTKLTEDEARQILYLKANTKIANTDIAK